MKGRATHHSLHNGLLSAISCIYVDNLNACISEQELDDEFQVYGVIRRIWIGRKPPGYVFIDFDERRDSQDVIHDLDGKHNRRVGLFHTLKVMMSVMVMMATILT